MYTYHKHGLIISFRCSVVSVLQKFDLQFPEKIQGKLNVYVCLPSHKLPRQWRALKTPLLAVENKCVQLSQDLSLSNLKELVTDLTIFLDPLKGDLDTIVFFHERQKLSMFNTYLTNYSRRERERVENQQGEQKECIEFHYLSAFFNALQSTIQLVEKIISGEATYGESVIEHSLNLSMLDVDAEFNGLMECPKFATNCTTGQTGLKCMFKLMQFAAKYYDSVISVCKQYNLEQCLDDPELHKVKDIISSVQNKEMLHQLTATDALVNWQVIEGILKIQDKKMECLKIFAKIADCAEFYQFLEERNYTGPNCAELFRNQLRLTSQQLEHDMTDHDLMVMDHLYSSISFIAPFLDKSQSFGTLMECVSTLDTTTGLSQLDTVRSKMHLVHVWFSKAQVTCCLSHDLLCVE